MERINCAVIGEDGTFRSPDDIPTITGFEIGRDLDWWEKLTWIDA